MKNLVYWWQVSVKELTMKQKNKKFELLDLLGTLGTSLLGSILSGKGVIWAAERTIKASQHF